ncbi:MAG: hypothetical protein M5U28_16870 [Sandaracinaceae bacterium]|nr:hypothetical protein [Sandaracinaceae bacterium]
MRQGDRTPAMVGVPRTAPCRASRPKIAPCGQASAHAPHASQSSTKRASGTAPGGLTIGRTGSARPRCEPGPRVRGRGAPAAEELSEVARRLRGGRLGHGESREARADVVLAHRREAAGGRGLWRGLALGAPEQLREELPASRALAHRALPGGSSPGMGSAGGPPSSVAGC